MLWAPQPPFVLTLAGSTTTGVAATGADGSAKRALTPSAREGGFIPQRRSQDQCNPRVTACGRMRAAWQKPSGGGNAASSAVPSASGREMLPLSTTCWVISPKPGAEGGYPAVWLRGPPLSVWPWLAARLVVVPRDPNAAAQSLEAGGLPGPQTSALGWHSDLQGRWPQHGWQLAPRRPAAGPPPQRGLPWRHKAHPPPDGRQQFLQSWVGPWMPGKAAHPRVLAPQPPSLPAEGCADLLHLRGLHVVRSTMEHSR